MGNIIKYLTISATVGLTALGLMSNVCAMEMGQADTVRDTENDPQVIFEYSDGIGGYELVTYRFSTPGETVVFGTIEDTENNTYRLYFCEESACYDANINYNPMRYMLDENDGQYKWIGVYPGYDNYTSPEMPRTAMNVYNYGVEVQQLDYQNLEAYTFNEIKPTSSDPVDPGNNDPVDPTPSSDLSISSVFSNVTGIVTGVVTGALGVLTTMWGNPIGQVTILSGLAATVIGFGLSIVTRKRKMK